MNATRYFRTLEQNFGSALIAASVIVWFSAIFGSEALRWGIPDALAFEWPLGGTGLTFHTYTPIFYGAVLLLIFIPRYKQKALPYFVILWSLNELAFDFTYWLLYPQTLTDGAFMVQNWVYIAVMTTLGALLIYKMRPFHIRKTIKVDSVVYRFPLALFAFPFFWIAWASAGAPLDTGNINNWGWHGWLWEFAYQIACVVSFMAFAREDYEEIGLEETEESPFV